MNAFVWTTFALVVFVAPTLAVGAGAVLGNRRTSRRQLQPVVVAPELVAPVAVLAPVPPASPVEAETTTAAARPQISVEPRPGGRWAVQKDGAKRASRVFDTKDAAVARALALATRENAEVVVRDEHGDSVPELEARLAG